MKKIYPEYRISLLMVWAVDCLKKTRSLSMNCRAAGVRRYVGAIRVIKCVEVGVEQAKTRENQTQINSCILHTFIYIADNHHIIIYQQNILILY